jgi:predicted nucleic acid-binding protein
MDKVFDEECLLSFISEVELQVWNPENPEDIYIYQQFVAGAFVFGINEDIVREAIRIRKQNRIKLPDAFIAATAIVYGFTLIADNDKDFSKIVPLKYINPSKPVEFI